MPQHGRHAAPRDPARRRAVLLPGVLLLASGTALAGMAVLPAAADDRARTPAVAAPAVAAEVVAAPAAADQADLALLRTLRQDAAREGRTARASRDRAQTPARPAAPPPPGPPPPAPGPAPVKAAPAAPAPPQFVRPGTGRLTSSFGHRWGRLHAGIDLAAGIGAPISAVTTGTVTTAGTEGGYGNVVRLQHADATVTVYAHLSEIRVTVGQRVSAGHVVGLEGNSGHSTGPHLHFEVRVDDVPVDPAAWLRARGVAP